MISKFLYFTAWTMTPPKAYGAFHILFFIFGIILSVAVAWHLRNTDEKQNKKVLFTVGSILLITEIYKQLFYTYVIGKGEYQWWIFPFQLCSIPMYFCLIIPFMKDGILKDSLYDFMLAFNLFGGFVSFIEPSGLIHEYWTLTLHAFCWHMLLIFLGIYIAFSKRGGQKLSNYKRAVAVFVCLCCVAFIINLLLFKAANGDINMFYVGPEVSPIIVFKDISVKYGSLVNTPLYMFSLCLGAFIFYMPISLFKNKKDRVKTNTYIESNEI